MTAGCKEFVSVIECGFGCVEHYEVLFFDTEWAFSGWWVKAGGLAHNFPQNFEWGGIIFQLPHIVTEACPFSVFP